jgi:prepilin-type N-terminal cleavage/methylation domain-containing protein
MTFPTGNAARRGYTLMEMLLVVAITVAMAAMVLPALSGPMQDQRLLKAADLIRAEFNTARLTAMKSGRIQLFRYDVGANTYALEAWQGEADDTDPAASPTTPAAPATPLMTARQEGPIHTLDPATADAGQLPSNVLFYHGQTATDARSAQVEGTASSTSASATGEAKQIVFYPDGTATDASLVLTNERCFVEIKLRGLTGQSQASELLSEQELSR